MSSEPVPGGGGGVPDHSSGAASGSVDHLKRIPVIRQIVSAGDAEVGDRPKARKRSIRQSSCPPGGNRSISSSGPWSMEWLQSRNLGEVSSAPRVSPPLVEVDDGQCREKVGGVLNHNVHCLKKVARLSGSDRLEVLKMIRKQERKQQHELCLQQAMEGAPQGFLAGTTSSSSANNDWQHWVVMRGNEIVADDDVRGIGRDIGLDFPAALHNRFEVLHGEGKAATSGEVARSEGVGGSVLGGRS